MTANVPARVPRGKPHEVELRSWGHLVHDERGLGVRADLCRPGQASTPDPRVVMGLPLGTVVTTGLMTLLAQQPHFIISGLVLAPVLGWMVTRYRPAPWASVYLTPDLRSVLAAEAEGHVQSGLVRPLLTLAATSDDEVAAEVIALAARLVGWAPTLPPDLRIEPTLEALLEGVDARTVSLPAARDSLLEIHGAAQEWMGAHDELHAFVAQPGSGAGTDRDVADLIARLRSEARVLREAAEDLQRR